MVIISHFNSLILLIGDDCKLENSRYIQNSLKKSNRNFINLVESENNTKWQWPKQCPDNCLYTIRYYSNVSKNIGKYIDIRSYLKINKYT